MSGFWKLGGAVITTVMVALMLVVLFVALTWRFGLVSIKPALFYFAFGLTLMVGGGLLKLYEQWGGKYFALAGALLFVLGMYKAALPSTSTATNHAQEVADTQAAMAMNKAAAPKEIRCDRESKTAYWDQVTGEAVVFYAIDTDAHKIECVDRKGFHPVTRKEYKPVTEEILKLIVKQDPPEGPKPIPTPEPVQVAVATPVPTTMPTVAIPVAPVVQPTPEPIREYSTALGETLWVVLTESLDLGERGENYQFTGTLVSDVSDRNGVVLAKSGTEVGMMIVSLQLDPRTNAALLEMKVTSLTTTSGTPLPVSARQDVIIPVPPMRIGMKRNGIKGALVGAATGALIGGIRDGRRGAARYGAAGAAIGGGASLALTKGQYILPPVRIRMTIEDRWIVPAMMVASAP
ncbi:MAG: hypothetical protein AAB375_00655 [Patescibacteria group bacterium]